MYGWPHSNYNNLAATQNQQDDQKDTNRGDSKDHDSSGTNGTNNSQKSGEGDNATQEVVMDMYNNVMEPQNNQKSQQQ